jgi:hypothetical protein
VSLYSLSGKAPKEVHSIPLNQLPDILSLDFFPQGDRLLAITKGGCVQIDLKTGEHTSLLERQPTAHVLSTDGRFLIAGTRPNCITVYRLPDRTK